MEVTSSILSPAQRYAAAALFSLALHQSQFHERPTPSSPRTADADAPTTADSSSTSDNPELWIHDNSGLLLPVFRFLEVDEQAWHGLKETAGSSSQFRHHLGDFFKVLSEEGDASSKDRLDKEAALTNAVDATEASMKSIADSSCRGHEQKTRSEDNLCDTELKLYAVGAEPDGETKESSALLPLETQSSTALENEKPLEEASIISYQRKVTVLYTLLSACVADTAEVDKKFSKSRQGYDARHRVSLRLLAVWLGVEWNEMEAMESMVAYSIMESLSKAGEKEESIVSETSWDKWKRGGIVGAAAVTGGTVMAITGGLAAPAIAQGLGALAPTLGSIIPVIGAGGFAAAATATGSVAGSVAVAASFGAAGAGLTGSKMATRIGSLEEFELIEVGGTHRGHLAVRISISGLAFEEEDFIKPWEGHNDNMERYVLKYESKILIALSTAIQDWLTSKIMSELMKGGAMMTVLSTLVAALAWPATLVTAFDLIDSKWAVAVDRSEKAGKVLAEVLLKGLQGNRPATLVGFSLGARVIFKCLQCLADSKGDNAGLVERVVLLGAPISIKDENWEVARKMVAGRFVNAYSTNDWTLGITFRASLLSQGLAGIQPVDIPGIENVDVTRVIEGHSSYLWMTPKILEQLELDNYFAVYKGEHEKPQEEKSTMD
ncbi:putative alpha/Beta hydrolase [Medicago truncatula]|uniref:Putative alpha/Beta hydrolase n=1 Tax=Medicago truncatula TaxID=3880 RepID=G7J4N6_MEDTR|nr:transmembrane and coiled-coil domain-containing protein 4 [Medicago truncatula]AES73977.1 transmembrane and coiled-coil protein [Medicago truncatula]RHN71069.1 putative alpha/Beta hydrolase [Medicago truncatula]